MLILGDCFEVLPTLATGSVGMVFADLPYGVTHCAWDTPIDLARLWPELLRVGRQNCAFVFTATFRFAMVLAASQPKLFRYDLVWNKRRPVGHLNSRKQPLRVHELILVFCRASPPYTPQKTTGHEPVRSAGVKKLTQQGGCYGGYTFAGNAHQGKTDRLPVSIVSCTSEHLAAVAHPTQKPVALLEWLILTYSNPGDTILDPTCGSGTTAVAAIRTGRKYVCIEKDPTYHATAQARIAAETAQGPLFPEAQKINGQPAGTV